MCLKSNEKIIQMTYQNEYNLTEQERIDYLNNLRQKIRVYYSANEFDKAISSNRLAYDQGGELLEIWLQSLEDNYGKNPSKPHII